VDISETDCFAVCVDFTSSRNWLNNLADSKLESSCGTTITYVTEWFKAVMGYLFVAPHTALQTQDNVDLSINVWLLGKDMQFAYPCTDYMPSSRVIVESGETVNTDLFEMPVSCNMVVDNKSDASEVAKLTFGELFFSFRSYIKRFQTISRSTVGNALIDGVTFKHPLWTTPLPNFTTGSTFNANIIDYLRLAFNCMKGGIRFRLRFQGLTPTATNQIHVTVLSPSTTTPSLSLTLTGAGNAHESFLMGTGTYVPATQGGIEYSLPYFCNNLYLHSNNVTDPFAGTDMDTLALRGVQVEAETSPATTVNAILERAAADDLTFFYFSGWAPYTF